MNGLEILENPRRGGVVFDARRSVPDVHDRHFTVLVTRFDDVWLAECDRLGLVTEADDYATLDSRARRIAPELAEMNGLDVAGWPTRLQFQMNQSSSFRFISYG